ncbi:MAG: glycosyltransferase family 2 protein [Clostridium sp.]|nr:glycosyltransferase [[Clostridium] innocuum]MCR0527235.1 glycosyltransferase [[Clostridium] innocuum]MCR0626306.1 glycosyltransferase [[Clostridium] innocuum]
MVNNNSLVSILMAAYNSEKYISEAIESVLAQSYKNWELIICDDCSNDSTLQISKKYSHIDPRIKVIRNKENSGQATARNNAFKNCTGSYIAILDSDDRFHSDKIKIQVDFLMKNINVGFVGCCAYMFNEDIGVYGKIKKKRQPSTLDVLRNNGFVCATIMMKREVFEKVGHYTISKTLRTGEDYNLICKIYDAGYIGANLPEFLYEYRVDNTNYKRRNYSSYYSEFKTAFHCIRNNWFSRFNIPKKYMIFAFTPLIKGIIPKSIVKFYHKYRFNIKDGRNTQ